MSPVLRALAKESPTVLARIPQDPLSYLGFVRRDLWGLVCLAKADFKFQTLELNEIEEPLANFAFVVPANMTHTCGYLKNQLPGQGATGPRTDENTGRLRYIVFSAPSRSIQQQIDAVHALRKSAMLAFVVRTSGHSIEAWFVHDTLRIDLTAFRARAIKLGADWRIRIRCQPYALPGGINTQTGFRHEVIFHNPSAIKVANARAFPSRQKSGPGAKGQLRAYKGPRGRTKDLRH